MVTTTVTKQVNEPINGVNVEHVMNVIGHIQADLGYAKFQWRATNKWIDGGASRSRIKGFYAGNTEDRTRSREFTLDTDEPAIVAGHDNAPNSMEYVLHALASCLTGTLVYHAAVQGIVIEAVDSSLAGEMDVQGLFGLDDDVRKGFNKVTINMRVKSEANAADLTRLALYSPVYEMISRALPVEFTLTTY